VVDETASENITRKPELEESTKKHHTIHKYHPPSKEIKINGEETLILGVATDYVSPALPTRRPESSETATSTLIKATKSSKSDEKASKTEKPTEKTVLTPSKTKTFSTSTLNIETSSSVQVIESVPTKIVLRPTSATSADTNADTTKSSVVNLEPSRVPDIDHTLSPMYSVSTPTDALPTTYSTSSSTTKSIAHTTSSIFTKLPGMLKISISPVR